MNRDNNPLISIIMPNYNGAKFLHDSIGSVIGQTYPHWELLVCDDCSTDNSVETIRGFRDERIRAPLIMDSNQGAAIARNKGIECAAGSFIAFLDHDDYWAPRKLEMQINYMLDNGYQFTYTDYIQFSDTSKKRIRSKKIVTYSDLLKNNYILTSTVMYNSDALGKVYMENIRKRQDWSLFINLVKKSGKAHNLEEPLCYYRRHAESLSAKKMDLLRYNFDFYNKVLGLSRIRSTILMARFLFYYFLKKFMERL